MADIVVIVDTDSANTERDYSSLALAEAGEQATYSALTTDENTITFQCQAGSGVADTSPVVIDGWVPSTDYFLKVQGEAFGGKLDETKYRIQTTSLCIYIVDSSVIIETLQLINPGTSNRCIAINKYVTDVTVQGCLIKGGTDGIKFELRYSFLTRFIYNNIVYDCANYGIAQAGEGTILWRNNTVVDCAVGGLYCNVGCSPYSNIAYGNGTDFTNRADDYGGYNFSGDATAVVNNSLNNQPDPFVDYANDDFHLNETTNARGAAWVSSDKFTIDIDGDTRVAWDIGADEYSSLGVLPIKFTLKNRFSTPSVYRSRNFTTLQNKLGFYIPSEPEPTTFNPAWAMNCNNLLSGGF